MVSKKILLGLTTFESDYKEKIKEIDKFNIKEISLFLTCVGYEDRKEIYKLLKKTGLESIPHIHLRDDMNLKEIEYLEKRFNTQVFNIHGEKSAHPFLSFRDYPNIYRSKIYIENQDDVLSEEELKFFGGICIDFSHWQDKILFNRLDYDKKMRNIAKEFHIGCSHISAVGNKVVKSVDFQFKEKVHKDFSKHHLDDLSELDYIKNFINYLPNLISLELTNSFKEQLEIKKYLEKIINK